MCCALWVCSYGCSLDFVWHTPKIKNSNGVALIMCYMGMLLCCSYDFVPHTLKIQNSNGIALIMPSMGMLLCCSLDFVPQSQYRRPSHQASLFLLLLLCCLGERRCESLDNSDVTFNGNFMSVDGVFTLFETKSSCPLLESLLLDGVVTMASRAWLVLQNAGSAAASFIVFEITSQQTKAASREKY